MPLVLSLVGSRDYGPGAALRQTAFNHQDKQQEEDDGCSHQWRRHDPPHTKSIRKVSEACGSQQCASKR